MPEIARFYGIIIKIYFNDHNPPHFHAYYGEYDGAFDIQTLEMIYADLPKKSSRTSERVGWTISWKNYGDVENEKNWKTSFFIIQKIDWRKICLILELYLLSH